MLTTSRQNKHEMRSVFVGVNFFACFACDDDNNDNIHFQLFFASFIYARVVLLLERSSTFNSTYLSCY